MSTDQQTVEKRWAILQRLLDRTRAGKTHWEPLGDSDTRFMTAVGDYSITIESEDVRSPSRGPFKVTVRDYPDRILDQFDQYELDSVATESGELATNLLADLYEAARRRAFNVDEAMSDLLNQLGDDD